VSCGFPLSLRTVSCTAPEIAPLSFHFTLVLEVFCSRRPGQAKHGGTGLKIINILVVCYSLLYFDGCMITSMEKKGVLPSTTHFVLTKDQGNIFSCHYFVAFLFLLSFLYRGEW